MRYVHMKQLTKPYLLLSICIVTGIGLAALFFFTHDSHRDASDTSTENGSIPQAASQTNLSVQATVPSEFTTSYISSIVSLSNLQSPYSRREALHVVLEDTSKADLLNLLHASREFAQNSSSSEIRSTIVWKLASIDARAAFEQMQAIPAHERTEHLRNVFLEWGTSNLDEAIQTAKKLKGRQQESALKSILDSQVDLSGRELREIARQVGNESLAAEAISAAAAERLMEDPEKAWQVIVEDDVDNALQVDVLVRIVNIWTEQAGVEEVLSRVVGTPLGDDHLRDSVVRTISDVDPARAIEYLRTVSENERETYATIVASYWAREDPQSALEAASTLEPPELREALEHSLIYSWSQSQPRDVIENVEMLRPHQRSDALGFALIEIAKDSPEEAIAHLESLEAHVDDTSIIALGIVMGWSESDPHAAAEWVLSKYEEHDQRRMLLNLVLRSFAFKDPAGAFEMALDQPVQEHEQGLEVDVVNSLTANGKLDEALELLPRVRQEFKIESYVDVGKALVRNNQPDRAIGMAQQFTGQDRVRYYLDVISSWAEFNPSQLYESLGSLPSVRVQSYAAQILITHNRTNGILTDDQMARARSYLSNSDTN